MSLFIASTGLIMSPRFLAAHLPVLAAGMFLVVLGKSILVRLAFSELGHRECLATHTRENIGLCMAYAVNEQRKVKCTFAMPSSVVL